MHERKAAKSERERVPSLPAFLIVALGLALGLAFFLSGAGKAEAAISYVQSDVEWGNSLSTSTFNCYLRNPVTAGDLVIGVLANSTDNVTATTTDSLGNSFGSGNVLYNSAAVPSTGRVSFWYATSSLAGASDTLTAVTALSDRASFICAEYSGLSNLSPFDVASSTESAATTTSLLSPNVTTTFGGELLLGLGNTSNNTSSTFTPGNGWTLRVQGPTSTPYEHSFLEDQIAGAAGSYNAQATATVADNWNTSIIAFSATSTSCTANGNCYIVPGGTGLQNGLDWNNAYSDLPATLSCGTNYFLAGGTYDYTASSTTKTWNTNCTASSSITIYKAIAGGPGNPDTVAGWQASYGTSQAVFNQTTDADPEKNYLPFFNFCGNYYTLDGVVPTSGTPSSSATYGIILKTQNDGLGFVKIGTNICSSQPSNITIRHVEFNGIKDPYGVTIVSGSRSSNTVTLTLATTSPWVVSDTINVYNASTTDFNVPTSAVSIATVSGTVITYAQTGSNETMVTTTLTYAVDGTGNWRSGLYAPISPGVSNVTLSDSYLHDVGGGLAGITCSTCHFDRNYIARDMYSPANHENGISINASSTNVYIDNNVWEDINGTSIIASTGNLGFPVVVNGFYYYNNLAFCSKAALANPAAPGLSVTVGGNNTDLSPQCGVSSDISDDNGANITTNAFMYGNTFANTATGHCGAEFDNTSSIATMENNLYYGCPGTSIRFFAGSSTTEGYNTVLHSSSTFSASGTLDYFLATGTDPFANDADSAKNFRLSSETIDLHLNDGTSSLLSPYNLDLTGATRGADGTWERGAYEFNSSSTPGTPGIPTYSSIGSSTMTIAWTSASGANSYILQRATSSQSYAQIATTTSLSDNDSGLTGNTSYFYDVIGSNSNGNGSTSATSSQLTLPAAPGTPTYTSIASSSLTVNWTAPGGGAASYKIERATSSGSFAQIATTTSLSYNDTGLSASTAYLYRLRGTNATGDGGYGASSTVTTASSGGGGGSGTVVMVGGGSGTYAPAATTTTAISSISSASSTLSLQAEISALIQKLQSLLAEANQRGIATTPNGPPSLVVPARDLQFWDRGADVTTLQEILTEENTGPSAARLKAHGTTTVFGSLTYRALREFQASHTLPVTGYFGPLTRARMKMMLGE